MKFYKKQFPALILALVLSLSLLSPAAQGAFADPLTDSNSLDLMDALELDGLTGDGLVIAVIDSGLRYTHRAFAENDLMQNPAIGLEDVAAFIEEGGTQGRYISQRIPFAYDYANNDREVYTPDSHGTHVTALAAGYAVDNEGEVEFRGVAPAAQILSMKVFPDNAEAGASDDAILRAMEDAYLLGADVICMSLGVEGGFSTGSEESCRYTELLDKLHQAGIIVCCAAGNSATSVSSKPEGITLPTTEYTDYGTVATPASYTGTTAIAAAYALTVQGEGYIQAGERKFSFTEGTTEAGDIPVSLETLAGRSLSFALVGGLGRKEDFAAANVRGKVALVQRGEITFSEKAQNAAKAGAVACLFLNNVEEDVIPTIENTSIPCAIISKEDSTYLKKLADAGQTDISFQAGAYLHPYATEPSIMAQSAWGAPYDLRIAPALTAPGGGILSASAEGDDLYEQFSGTSMAAPNAAGAYALVLEKLYSQGVTDKKEAADMAQALLTGSAQLLLDSNGTPVSPRRQGAGLIDLQAATGAKVLIAEPLLELGDSAAGRFTLSFGVKNLTDEELTLDITPTVLTDNWTQAEGRIYSTLTARDLTEQVTISGPKSITLSAGSERTVTLQLSVPETLRRDLTEIYPNGFFLEGYISLSDMAHATFLGYCGDWEAADIVEQRDFRDVLDAAANGKAPPATDLGLTMVHISGDSSLILGQNPHLDVESREERFAISTFDHDAHFSDGTLFSAQLVTLRNAQHLIMVISDQSTGQVYYVSDASQMPRSTLSDLTGEIAHSATFQWSGTTVDGTALPDGTRVDVEFYGWTESDDAMARAYAASGSEPTQPGSYRWLTTGTYDRALQWSFPLVIDRSAPTVSAELAADGKTLTVTAADKQFLAYAAVESADGTLLAQETYAGEQAGERHSLTVDLTDYAADTVYIIATDYAANTAGYMLDLSTEHITPTRCAMSLLTDVDMDAWYHSAVDLVWEAGIMDSGDDLDFRPNKGATRADVVDAIHRAADSPEGTAPLSFRDVNAGAEYYRALQWATGEGIITGITPDTFAAFAFVSRQQLVTILYRYANTLSGVGSVDTDCLNTFSDVSEVDSWAREAMAWAVEEGLITGRAGNTLSPDAHATRAELAQILVRFLDL